MCQEFSIDPSKVRRPKKIKLLISMGDKHLHPDPIKRIGKMKLADGPLGLVFGGTNPKLLFESLTLCCPTKCCPTKLVQVLPGETIHTTVMKNTLRQATYMTPMRSEKGILNFFEEEKIGVHCEPGCGDCRCGTCALGAKQMSIHDEKEYE